jgi:hypothetical protein
LSKAQEKLIETAKKRYKLALDRDSSDRADRLDDLRFSVLLEQWPEDIKSERENDPNGSRPCLVVDKTNQFVRQIVNDIRQNRPAIKVRAVNDDADQDVAEIIEGLTRHIEDQSRADQAYDWAAESAVRCGIGYFRVITQYNGIESFDQDIVIQRVTDIMSVLLDPDSVEPDGSDAKWGFITTSFSKDEFESQFPDAEPVDFECDKDVEWFGEKRVIVAEYFYLVKKTSNLLFLEDGTVQEESEYWQEIKDGAPKQKVLKSRPSTTNVCMWAKMNGKEVMEEKEFPSRFIPIIPVIGNEGFVDGKRVLTGIIRAAKDAQRLYNYVRSSFTEAVALAPKAPFIAAAGQIDDYPEWEDANAKNYSVLRYKPMAIGGVNVGAPQRQAPAGVPSGLAQDMEIAEHDIQSAIGMFKASLGQESNEKSGRAIMARQKEGDTSTFHFSDNLARSISHCGRMIVEMIPKIYDTQRTLRIIGKDGTPDYAKVDPEQDDAVSEMQDLTGAMKKVYNLGVGLYDVTVTVGPSYNTKRMEAADAMTQILQGNPDLMKIIGDLYFKSMDMPFSDEIAERMKKLLPPELHEQQDGQPPIPPQIQQQMQQAQQMIQQLDHVVQQMQQENDQLKFQQQAKVVENQGKIAEARVHQESELARALADVEIAKAGAIDPARLNAAESILASLMVDVQNQQAQQSQPPAPAPAPDPMQQQNMMPPPQIQPGMQGLPQGQ